MNECDLLVVGGRILDLDTDSGTRDGHAVVIVGQRIVEVIETAAVADRWRPLRTIDAGGGVVSPGFVDAHVHLAAFLGAAQPYARSTGPSLFSGGKRISDIVPAVAQMTSMHLPGELTEPILRPVFAAMLRCGITSVVDAGSAGHDGIVRAAVDVGIRAAIGPSLADRWHDDSGNLRTRADASELLERAAAWIDDNDDGTARGRVRTLVSAVETIACSDQLLGGIARLGAEYEIPTHVHSHITAASDKAHQIAYGTTTTQRLHDAGMLSPRCTLMHAGNASADDIDAFRAQGITVNHNPLGNAMLGFHTTSTGAIPAMIEAGVPLVLGSDYAPSMIASPFEMMRAGLAIHREALQSDYAITIESMLRMATNPGTSVGRPGEVGRIEPGQLADLVIVDTSGPHHLGDRHPVPTLALRANTADIRHVIVDGVVVIDDTRLTTIDEDESINDARAALQHLGAR